MTCNRCKGEGQTKKDKKENILCTACEGLGFYPWVDPANE